MQTRSAAAEQSSFLDETGNRVHNLTLTLIISGLAAPKSLALEHRCRTAKTPWHPALRE